MDRKKFLKNTLMLSTASIAAPAMIRASNIKIKHSDYDRMLDQVGFNHIPNKEDQTMNTILHKADTRGHANHGWLDTHHSFSFANYYNPERMHFGVLRVLNDDWIARGKGFGTHPHDNMEIISIPLEGALEHQDSMGNKAIIEAGDIQVMSAGTGIFHSEFNKYQDQDGRFLQIWLFPNKKQVEPRYDQISLKDTITKNKLSQILSPSPNDEGVWIHQDAWFHWGEFDQETKTNYQIKKKGNGLYAFLLEGEAVIAGQKLEKRDGFGIWDEEEVELELKANSKLLLMDIPMNVQS